MLEEVKIELIVENSPTILQKVIQVIKRRRINIRRFVAEEKNNADDGSIEIIIVADSEKTRLVKSQIRKLIEVIEVKE